VLRTVSNGQSIHQYIPPDLRRVFYKNPNARHASQNGHDPYGFTTNGLVLYLPLWALNNGGTNSIQSVDAYRHTGTITGALWQPDGRLLDGTDDCINCGANAALGEIADFSFMAWVNFDVIDRLEYIGFKGIESPYADFAWRLLKDTEEKIQLQGSNGVDAFTVTKISDTTVAATTWYLLGFSYSSNGGNAIIYRQGVADGTGAITGNMNANTTMGLYLGCRKRGTSDNFLKGYEAEVWYYNRVLTASEFLLNYTATMWRY